MLNASCVLTQRGRFHHNRPPPRPPFCSDRSIRDVPIVFKQCVSAWVGTDQYLFRRILMNRSRDGIRWLLFAVKTNFGRMDEILLVC